jgi:hypothetical protein
MREPLTLGYLSLPQTSWYLPYWVDRDKQPGNQPSQYYYADDDRIDVTMDSLEHPLLTHFLSIALAVSGPPARWLVVEHASLVCAARCRGLAPSGQTALEKPLL